MIHSIQSAMPSDLAAIRERLVGAGLVCEDLTVDLLADFRVCRFGGAVIGCAGLEVRLPYALLRSVWVAPAWRRSGLGAALTRSCLDEASARGVRAVYLLTETAKDYFLAFGFTAVARADCPDEISSTREFSALCPVSSACLRREL
jgi:amino-acid N-acetyltransferase